MVCRFGTVKVMTSITAKNALTAAPLNSAVLQRQQRFGYQVPTSKVRQLLTLPFFDIRKSGHKGMAFGNISKLSISFPT